MAILRDRFRVGVKLPYVSAGRKRKVERTAKPWKNMAWPEIIPDTKRAPGWAMESDPKPVPILRHKRGKRAVALVVIAGKINVKLHRRFVSAEDYLAERAKLSRL